MAAAAVNYCNFSLQAFLYHYMVLNEHKHEEFNDDLYDEIVDSIKGTGNQQLIATVPENNLREEAAEIYERVWERM